MYTDLQGTALQRSRNHYGAALYCGGYAYNNNNVIVAEINRSESHAVDALSKHYPVAAEQVQKSETTPSSPPCGKTCSYEWDKKEDGKYYPLLYKAVNCTNTLYRMAHSPCPVIRPPPRFPPPELLTNFTIDGQCPVSVFRYYDESKKVAKSHYSVKMFRKLLDLDNVTNINRYRDKNTLKPALLKYKHLIRQKRVAVVGTETPWAEAILLNLGAISVITVEYRKLVIEDERVITTTPYILAEQFLSGHGVPFDTVFTYSSLEHSGLGRYGDPITPFGDLEATAQVWCMVKPGGHFILAVMVSEDRNSCSIVWNAHRIYGSVRLQHLTANWRVLDEFRALDRMKHRIFVMQKV